LLLDLLIDLDDLSNVEVMIVFLFICKMQVWLNLFS